MHFVKRNTEFYMKYSVFLQFFSLNKTTSAIDSAILYIEQYAIIYVIYGEL
jgi:hypothetical protein